jgi:outer membrane protein OmpA-like peptidoglycan-associated protein
MRKLLLIGFILASIHAVAQDYAGYNTSNYSGVNSVFFNPGNVVDSRYKWSVNLVSANINIANDYATLKTSGLFKTLGGDTSSYNINRTNFGNTNFLLNADIFGPSVMFNINSKNSLAITTRGRAMANVDKMPGDLLNTLENSGQNVTFPASLNTNGFKVSANIWTEIGITYGRVLIDKTSFLKGGITVKYLGGVGAGYFSLDANGKIDKDPAGNNFIQNTTGQLNYGLGGEDVNNINFNFNGSGIGADIGFVYEYRPTYITAKDENKYKFKIEAAIHDLGSIKYNHGTSDAAYSLNTNLNPPYDSLRLDRFSNISSFNDIDTALNSAGVSIAKTSNATGKFNMSLPTSLSGSVDYHVVSGFYVNLGGSISLANSSNLFKTHTANYITLTPRYEGKHFGAAIPISNSSISGFNAGISLRAGPIFLGSGSILSTLLRGNTQQADIHFGIIINGLHKKPRVKKEKEPLTAVAVTPVVVPIDTPIAKIDTPAVKITAKFIDTDGDGITDSLDKCPTVAGLAKYNGCPIPDSDSDGVNDEADKCPTIPGLAKYNGCPIPDSDSDGVNDEVDKCPTIKGFARYNGCPIPDSDSDGVNDEVDKCPTIAGPASNDGCPLPIPVLKVQKSIIQKVNIAAKGLQFQTGKAVILKQSFAKLNTVIQILKSNPTLNIDIAGYTDNSGDSAKNQKLSADRAKATKAYFVKKGIAENRISTEGYGNQSSIAPNNTPAGRAKNRRVEFTLKNY